MFAAEGATVIATDINQDTLDTAAASSDNIETRILDVLDSDAVNSAAQDVGAVDILANVAGFVHHGSILDCDEEAWDFSFDLNIKSMHPRDAGISSGNVGKWWWVHHQPVFRGVFPERRTQSLCLWNTTKAAVIGLTKAIAIDFIRQGVRCNAICPGTIFVALAGTADR